jgi:hypothetical protein
MNLLEKILNSNTTLIGYDTQNEISVEKLLRFLPSVTFFEEIEATEVLEHFNSLSHFRDYKLDSLLNGHSVNYIIVDLSTIKFNEGDEIGDKYQETFSKAKSIANFVRELQSRIYTLSNTESLVKFKLILLSNIYVSMTPMNIQVEFKGGMTLVYVADLVVKFLGDSISIEKDRYDSDYLSRNTKQEFREISIKLLFDEITTTT